MKRCEKKRVGERRGGGGSHFWLDVRMRGEGHSDAYCVQQGWVGGGGVSKNQEKMRT